MDATDAPVHTGRQEDLDLLAIGTDIPDGAVVVWVTEIDNPDGVFAGQWVDEQRLARVLDGDLYIRLGRAEAETVDAELILAHDAHLTTVVRLAGVVEWAEQLRVPAAAVMALHTDLESGKDCRARAGGLAPAR